MNLNGNTILITGGSSGIGREMAKEFIKQNNRVIITGRSAEKLEKARDLLGEVTAIQSDVSSATDIEKLYQQISKDFPDLNILINNAGIMWEINLQDHKHSAADLTKELDVNVKGTIWMNDAFLPLLKKNNGPIYKSKASVTVSVTGRG